MNKLSIITVAIVLGLGGAAMAGDSGENHQDNTNVAGTNPFMPEFSAPAPQARGAYAKVEHVKRDVKN
jgi:hypothetical protein